MQVIVPGYSYAVFSYENKDVAQELHFIHKEKPADQGVPTSEVLETVSDGTTNEEVLAVLIDRLKYLNAKVPDRLTALAITDLQSAENWLLRRTRERTDRGVLGTHKA